MVIVVSPLAAAVAAAIILSPFGVSIEGEVETVKLGGFAEWELFSYEEKDSRVTIVRLREKLMPFSLGALHDLVPWSYPYTGCMGVFVDQTSFVTATHCGFEGEESIEIDVGCGLVFAKCNWKKEWREDDGCNDAKRADLAVCVLEKPSCAEVVPIDVAKRLEGDVALFLLRQDLTAIAFEAVEFSDINYCFEGKAESSDDCCERSSCCIPGDSGGPVFSLNEDKNPVLVAVLSSPGSECSCWMSSVLHLAN